MGSGIGLERAARLKAGDGKTPVPSSKEIDRGGTREQHGEDQ